MDENIQLAIRLCETGNFQKAIKRCLEILKVYPNNIEALNCLGVAAFNIERYDVSEICFRKIIELDPANRKVSDDLKATLSERKLLEKINSQQIAIDNVK